MRQHVICCKSKHGSSMWVAFLWSSKRGLERVEDFCAQFADRNLLRQQNRQESVEIIKTYGIQNEETLMERPVGRASGNAFKESGICVEEVRVRERDRKTVIAVSNIDESFGQAFSCGSERRQKLVAESELKARSRAVSEIAAIASFAYATSRSLLVAQCLRFQQEILVWLQASTQKSLQKRNRQLDSLKPARPAFSIATLLLHDRSTLFFSSDQASRGNEQ